MPLLIAIVTNATLAYQTMECVCDELDSQKHLNLFNNTLSVMNNQYHMMNTCKITQFTIRLMQHKHTHKYRNYKHTHNTLQVWQYCSTRAGQFLLHQSPTNF